MVRLLGHFGMYGGLFEYYCDFRGSQSRARAVRYSATHRQPLLRRTVLHPVPLRSVPQDTHVSSEPKSNFIFWTNIMYFLAEGNIVKISRNATLM